MLSRLFISVFCLSLLSACSTVSKEKQDADYVAYLSAQREHVSAHKQEVQLVRIVAQPGATITMSGVSEFSVFMPAAPAPIPQQKQAQSSEFVQVLDRVMPVVGLIGGVLAGGQATKGLATAVGNAANAGYSHVQAPAPNYTISGGVTTIGSGSASNGGGIVGSGTQSVGTGGVMGSGTALSGTGSTGAGGFSSTAMTNSKGVLGAGTSNIMESSTGSVGGGAYNPITGSYNPTTDTHAVTNSNNPTTDTHAITNQP